MAVFTVTNTNASGAGSLAEAVTNANALAGVDTITFAGIGGQTIAVSGLVLNDVNVDGDLDNNGTADITLSFQPSGVLPTTGAIFGVQTTGTVNIDGIRFANANIHQTNGSATATYVGGLYNTGTTTVTHSAFSNNNIANQGGQGTAVSAILNEGTLTVSSTDISGNFATAGKGVVEYGDAFGNAGFNAATILNRATGTLTLDTVTIAGNHATGGNGADFGGIPAPIRGGDGGDAAGVAINQGMLTLSNVMADTNPAVGGNGGNAGYGTADGGDGGDGIETIFNTGTVVGALTVTGASFHPIAGGFGGKGSGTGGAPYGLDGQDGRVLPGETGTSGPDIFNAPVVPSTLPGSLYYGLGGGDQITGAAAADTLYGDDGNDIIHDGDVLGPNHSLPDRLYGGDGNDQLFGGIGQDVLDGGAGDDIVDGGSGNDIMKGGTGNDLYYVNSPDDIVNDNVRVDGGIDTIRSTINWSLADPYRVRGGIENLELLGTAVTGTGNALDNILTGNAVANNLNGGAGADTMQGGAGGDSYTVDNAGDTVDESVAGSDGIDTVLASISWDLGDLIHNKGVIENLLLLGSADGLTATGNGLANTLTGNAGSNTLNGGGGADLLRGLAGNDFYGVGEAGDVVDETGGSGIDRVVSSINWNLGDTVHNKGDVEQLQITGSATMAVGNGFDNLLIGNALSNVLDGGSGIDTMQGGGGNDVYYVDNYLDVVDESVAGSTGSDQVRTSNITVYLSDTAHFKGDIESVLLLGNLNISAAGNALANTLTGNIGNNVLYGGDGRDILTGGAGDDAFRFDTIGQSAANVNRDIITDFNDIDGPAGDTINVSGIDANTLVGGNQALVLLAADGDSFTGAGQLRWYTSGGNTFVEGNVDGNLGADFSIQLTGLKTLGSDDFLL
ncbi:hypothetical protein NKH73_29385 [Mesorhizobium sp. M0938]|uniref:beta strand repeat-containing protein n=1 Tax=unclassified Mesorhizobium TaxID=325217 RepID=UPI00333968F7